MYEEKTMGSIPTQHTFHSSRLRLAGGVATASNISGKIFFIFTAEFMLESSDQQAVQGRAPAFPSSPAV